jgi:hypothetical protein
MKLGLGKDQRILFSRNAVKDFKAAETLPQC